MTLMVCVEPGVPISKFAACVPAMAFEFRMNWRIVPCCRRAFDVSSSVLSPRGLTIALKLKPELMSLTLLPASVTLVTCSAVLIEARALSDAPALRPP